LKRKKDQQTMFGGNKNNEFHDDNGGFDKELLLFSL